MMIIGAERVKDEDGWLGSIQRVHIDVNERAAKFMQTFQEEKITSVNHSEQKSSQIKPDRIKMPTFDGNIRDYPRFKSNFLKQVQPQIKEKDKTAYALKSCLSETPYELI